MTDWSDEGLDIWPWLCSLIDLDSLWSYVAVAVAVNSIPEELSQADYLTAEFDGYERFRFSPIYMDNLHTEPWRVAWQDKAGVVHLEEVTYDEWLNVTQGNGSGWGPSPVDTALEKLYETEDLLGSWGVVVEDPKPEPKRKIDWGITPQRSTQDILAEVEQIRMDAFLRREDEILRELCKPKQSIRDRLAEIVSDNYEDEWGYPKADPFDEIADAILEEFEVTPR